MRMQGVLQNTTFSNYNIKGYEVKNIMCILVRRGIDE